MKVTRLKIATPFERSCQSNSLVQYESHIPSKVMANVKVKEGQI